MMLNLKDRQILEHIYRYCSEIELALTAFHYSYEEFLANPVFINACSMPMMQIGELAKKFSPHFLEQHKYIPWKQIKGMRDIFAHNYHSMNKKMIWETATKEIPAFKENIASILGMPSES